ncbi:MAG: DUF4870 domain-containing protein [Nanoarchaeota archaeon]|nr:DUF4870 domain-containing protein [Nanoarchaeota archaeon]
MAKKKKKPAKKEDDSKLFAFLAVFLSIIGFIIALLVKKENKYVMYYAKQSLVLFIGWVIVSIIGIVPILGWVLAPIGWIILIILWIIALVNSLSGKLKETPLVGKYAKKFDF